MENSTEMENRGRDRGGWEGRTDGGRREGGRKGEKGGGVVGLGGGGTPTRTRREREREREGALRRTEGESVA